jgi:hypothetical protein
MKDFHRRAPVLRYGAWLVFGILLYVYLSLFKNALIDDAFITFRYVKTLLSSGTWGFFPGVIANSATSPLNVVLLALVSLFTGPDIESAIWLYLVSVVCIAFLLTRLSREVTGSTLYGWLAVMGLLFNPLLISTIGLESILFVTFFLLALYCYQRQKWTVLGVALGGLTLCRPDGLLFLFVFVPFVPGASRKLHVATAYLLCILPWYLFSWIYLGSFIPDTFFIKTRQATWYQWDFFNGIPTLYYLVYPLATILSFIFLPVAAFLLQKKTREVKLLAILWLAGLIHFLAYSMLTVPPFHWYYVPQVITIILLGSLGLGVLYRNSIALWQQRLWATVTIVYFLLPALGMFSLLAPENFRVQEMPIHSNWGTHEQYREIGLWLRENYATETIRLQAGEIGALSYYCECRLLDRFSDRRWLKNSIAEHVSRRGIVSILWRVNFAFYSEPELPAEKYILAAYFADPHIQDEVLQEWTTSTRWLPESFLILTRE